MPSNKVVHAFLFGDVVQRLDATDEVSPYATIDSKTLIKQVCF